MRDLCIVIVWLSSIRLCVNSINLLRGLVLLLLDVVVDTAAATAAAKPGLVEWGATGIFVDDEEGVDLEVPDKLPPWSFLLAS